MYKCLVIVLLCFLFFVKGFSQSLILDTLFNYAGNGANNAVGNFSLQKDGKIIVGGSFTSYNNVDANGIARLNQDGTFDSTFNVGAGAQGFANITAVYATLVLPDKKILVAGKFRNFNGEDRNCIVKLYESGKVDSTFNVIQNASYINTLGMQKNGKIIIAGQFGRINDFLRPNIARLNENGSIDTTFNPAIWSYFINDFVIQPDDKIILTEININNGIVRLNKDGTLDSTFKFDNLFNDWITSLHLQSDGKLLAGGGFTKVNDDTFYRIVRLNSNGTIDYNFKIDNSINGVINKVTTQPSGKIILAGEFNSYNNILLNNLIRVNYDGSFDDTFKILFNKNAKLFSALSVTNKDIFICGDFDSINSYSVNNLAKLEEVVSADVSSLMYQKKNLIIFPNPSSDVISVWSEPIVKSIKLFGLTGNLVFEMQNFEKLNEMKLIIGNLKEGIYLLKAYYYNGEIGNSKIIKSYQ